MKTHDYVFLVIGFAIVIMGIAKVLDETKQSKEHHERFHNLIIDSVKMHNWYENVELEYQELNNVRP